MTTDPSWLYSTIAQSSAAIVAIIGGFITATVLSLAAEKRSIKNQLADKEVELNALEQYGEVVTPISSSKDQHGKKRTETEIYYVEQQGIPRLKEGISDLKRRLISFSFPPNLKWGIVVLGYLTVFCIFWPVIIIATEAFCPWSKNLTMYPFFFGILLVFAYIVFQIRTLRRK